MNIDSIKNGLVLDHIKAGESMRIYTLLELYKLDCCVAIIKNVPSAKMGKKDIIKIDTEMDIDLDILGFVDANITVNIIKDGKLKEKMTVKLPLQVKNLLKCKNPRCITSTEQAIAQIFVLSDKATKTYRCKYCESEAGQTLF